MPRRKPVIVEGKASGVSLDKAFKDAMKNSPTSNLNRYKLIEFRVEAGGVTGATTSFVKIEYSQG